MILKYGNVLLRAIELSDKKILKDMINDPEIEKMTGGWNFPVSDYNQEKWILNFQNSESIIRFMIEDVESGSVLGMIVLSDINWKDRYAFIQYKIISFDTKRKKGDTKNALYAVLHYAFDELGLHRIEGLILDYNYFSSKLLKSFNFSKEGVYRSRVFKDAKWHDQELYGLLSDEFSRYKDGTAPWQIIDA